MTLVRVVSAWGERLGGIAFGEKPSRRFCEGSRPEALSKILSSNFRPLERRREKPPIDETRREGQWNSWVERGGGGIPACDLLQAWS